MTDADRRAADLVTARRINRLLIAAAIAVGLIAVKACMS